MRLVRASIALAMVVAMFGVFLSWQARGQSPGVGPMAGGGSPFYSFGGAAPRDPEMTKLLISEASAEREVNTLVASYGRTEDDAERAKIKTKLGAALTKQFDWQQKRRELELTRLEAKLKKVRELMKKRGEERKTIIDKRLDQLVREAEGLGWSSPPGPRPREAGFRPTSGPATSAR